MEWKIGEIKQINGEWYQCVESDNCGKCSLSTTECRSGTKSDLAMEVFGNCSKLRRSDNKHVIFKKLEKVGEPYRRWLSPFNNIMVQRYRLYGRNVIMPDEPYMYFNAIDNTIEIEIKQTKEDMEEYKMHDAKEDIPEFDKVVDECLFGKKELKLKPFDLQKAKAGKPVCTRDGRKARIICFDRDWDMHIVALVADPIGETVHYYLSNGKVDFDKQNDEDLMMLPEKKEGWVNVYKGGLLDTKSYPTKKEAFDKACPEGYVDTVKISWEE